MDDVFDRMDDFLNHDDEIDDAAKFEAEMVTAAAEIKQINPPLQPKIAPAPRAPTGDFDPLYNVLNTDVMARFKDTKFTDSRLFTELVTTTITMEGFLNNVIFHEAELIDWLMPDEWIVVIRCNYGKLVYPGYQEPIKIKVSNRGRKKKEKKRKHRKIQGAGTDFNSQITFFVRSGLDPAYPVADDGAVQIPATARVYKFKVFRTGKIQLPGVQPELIDDVIDCVRRLVNMFEYHMNGPVQITNLNPVMKNYRFNLKLGDNIVDLVELMRLILRLKVAETQGDMGDVPAHPPIFDLKYSREDTKLSMRFRTPIHNKPTKKTRVNVFMRGKINILGAFDTQYTNEILAFLAWIFDNHSELIVSMADECMTMEYNVAVTETYEEIKRACYEMMYPMPALPVMTNEEVDAALSFIDQCYNELRAEANEELRTLVAGTDLEQWLCEA